MHRLFKKNIDILGDEIIIDGDDFHHIKNVLRGKNGELFEVVTEDNINICKIIHIDKKTIKARIVEKKDIQKEKLNITLYQGMTKSDKLEYIIQKSVELGVNTVVPIISKRVVIKLKDKNIEKKRLRYFNISKHAASQSKRNYIPEVLDPMKIEDIILEKGEIGLVAYENSCTSLKETLSENSSNNIKIVIGPEGGFEEFEIKSLEDKGFNVISLGNRILRTETAPINLLSILQYELGD